MSEHHSLPDVNYCIMYLNWKDDYKYDEHEIEFMIHFDERTTLKLKLINGDDTYDIKYPYIYRIDPVTVLEDFKVLNLFRSMGGEGYYIIPYGIMLQIMKHYDINMYYQYMNFHDDAHDVEMINYHKGEHQRTSELLLNMIDNKTN